MWHEQSKWYSLCIAVSEAYWCANFVRGPPVRTSKCSPWLSFTAAAAFTLHPFAHFSPTGDMSPVVVHSSANADTPPLWDLGTPVRQSAQRRRLRRRQRTKTNTSCNHSSPRAKFCTALPPQPQSQKQEVSKGGMREDEDDDAPVISARRELLHQAAACSFSLIFLMTPRIPFITLHHFRCTQLFTITTHGTAHYSCYYYPITILTI